MEDILILGVGVSPYKNDGVLRFEHFCTRFGLPYRILGDGKVWKGGDMFAGTGGGQKVNEILIALEEIENKLIIICDTFDLFPLASKSEIIEKFNNLCSNDQILFSSEVYCWPDTSLASSYPETTNKYRFLNSGSFIGYRDNIYNLIKHSIIKDNDDDQLYYTQKYLSGEKIILDHDCHLFQALNGCKKDIVVHRNRVYNKYTNSYPIFVHGNGPAKVFLNQIENHLITDLHLNYSFTSISKIINEPRIFFALYINSSVNSKIESFLKHVSAINYHNKYVKVYDSHNNQQIKNLIELIGFCYQPNTGHYVYNDFIQSNAEYYFLLEQSCIITKRDIFDELIPLCNMYQRIISPLLCHQKNPDITNSSAQESFCKQSEDYQDIIKYHKRGIWNVPYLSSALLIKGDIIRNWNLSKENKFSSINSLGLCYNLKKYTLFMYLVNYNVYGFLN